MDWGVISGRRSLRWKRFWKCEVLLNFPISILTGKCSGYIINESDVTVWWTAVGQFTFFIMHTFVLREMTKYPAKWNFTKRKRPRKDPGRKDFAKKSKLLMIQRNRWEGDMEDDTAAA